MSKRASSSSPRSPKKLRLLSKVWEGTAEFPFQTLAASLDSTSNLSFIDKKDWRKCDTLIYLGAAEAVEKTLPSLEVPEASGMVEFVKNNRSPGNKGVLNKFYVSAEGKFMNVYIVLLPKEASRHNCKYRPEAAAKQLATVADLTSLCETMKTVNVKVCVEEWEGALPLGLAVARAMPIISRKTNKGKDNVNLSPAVSVSFVGKFEKKNLDRLTILGEGIRLCAGLVDAPPNELNTSSYADYAVKKVRELQGTVHGLSIKIIKGKELNQQGMGGLWGVGKGNLENPPAMVILSHVPDATVSLPSVCLVGKGIVYDSGGLAIKSRDGMCGMKRDMGGSAAMFGAFMSLVRMGGLIGKRPLHCILCLAENSVSDKSFRNDDILRLYSGLTVEINNTDAEGRLVLADGVAYAALHLNPGYVIDMATLTGASGIATGIHHGAMLCSHEDLETKAFAAGKSSGDLVWPLLYCPEFHEANFSSSVADMKNSVSNRADAQVSCAGHFVGKNLFSTGYEGKWLHIDMAYPVHYLGERASGYGVGLISQLVSSISASE